MDHMNMMAAGIVIKAALIGATTQLADWKGVISLGYMNIMGHGIIATTIPTAAEMAECIVVVANSSHAQ